LEKREALLEKVRSHKKNVSQKELIELLREWGFVERKGKGDHIAFRHKELHTRTQIIPIRQDPVRVTIVLQVLKLIRELQEQQNG
jgi:predicted RNA binding protein YcfA (HicA-like mRNA interferase family)